MRLLDRPIFLVGHARGGSTMLSAILNWHSQVGPKHRIIASSPDINTFLRKVLDKDKHLNYSSSIEQKEIWFDYFGGQEVFAHMGRELIIETLNLRKQEQELLVDRLTENFTQRRFLSKAPTNSFRVRIIPQIFKDAKILAIYRSGPEVVSSWGKRPYGFVKSKKGERKPMSYQEGISLFSMKWYQTLDYLEKCRKEMNFLAIKYDDLVENPGRTLEKIFHYLELPIEDYIYEVSIEDRRSEWRKNIPWVYQPYLLAKTRRGQQILSKIH